MHLCTWRNCGAPATKKITIRIKHPTIKVMDEAGDIHEEPTEPRDLWRCDEHYHKNDDLDSMGVFIVER